MMKTIRKFIKNNSNRITIILFLSVIYNIFVSTASDLYYYPIIITFLISTWLIRQKSSYTFLFCLLLLFIIGFLYILDGAEPRTENASVWFVLFFAVGLFQKWREK